MMRSKTVRGTFATASPAPTARSGTALLDPTTVASGNDSAERAVVLQSYHMVGQELLRAATLEGRSQAAYAAVEVFRSACSRHPDDPSLGNGLGAALVEASRYGSLDAATAALTEAAAAFRAALTAAMRQNVPSGARLRYRGNLGLALWMLGEMVPDVARLDEAEQVLHGVAAELPQSSPQWPHVQDNLANTLMALGRIEEAIRVYQAALDCTGKAERARVLNNLGTAYAELGQYDQARVSFDQALTLQRRTESPLDWARTQHNIGTTLLRQALSDTRSSHLDTRLRHAVAALEAAREERQPGRRKLEWALTTTNLAAAYIGLGVQLCTRRTGADPNGGIELIRRALALYDESLPELSRSDQDQVRHDAAIATEILQRLTGSTQPVAEPWPTETYSQARRKRKENIVDFLTRVWLPFISAGKVDLAGLRARDPTAAKAIDNYTRAIDPLTGERRRLPPHLHIPTKRELTDQLAAQFPTPGDRPVRLDWALRARARRERMRK